jgi:PST family polysaccharide transporter
MAFELAAMFTSLITEPLRNVAVSSLSKLRAQPTRFKQHYLKAALGLSLVCFAATAVLVAASGELVTVFLGSKWQRSADLLRILGLSAGVSAVYMTNIWLHFSLGRADRMARWTLVETVAIAGGVTLGLRYGAAGVAWGYCLAMFLLCITGLIYAGRPVGLGLGELTGALWRPAVAAAAAGWLCWWVIVKPAIVRPHAVCLVLFCLSFCFLYACFILMLCGGIKTLRLARAHYTINGPPGAISAILTDLLGKRAS